MKFFTKLLIVLAAVTVLFALGDSLFNGLLHKDGYRPVTEQMQEIMTGTE